MIVWKGNEHQQGVGELVRLWLSMFIYGMLVFDRDY